MDKTIYVKGHYRNGKYVRSYRYVRSCKEPNFSTGRIGKSYRDDLYRKIIALRNYKDYQSPEYQVAQDYLEKECPQVAYIIGNSSDGTKKLPKKITKELYEKVNYAYDIIFTK